MQNTMTIRKATEDDVSLVLSFIKKLAIYEKMIDEVVATEASLHDSLFKHRAAEVLIGEVSGEPVGFALFFQTFSTFLGTPTLYLEDIYVDEDKRGHGYGKAMMQEVARIANDRGSKRLEWVCLDWNAPSIAFYKRIGAVALDEWVRFRLEGDALESFIST